MAHNGPMLFFFKLETYYDLTYTVVSLVFLSPLVGYIASAILNNWLHLRAGQRGISLLCSGCHIAAYLIICMHPPYVVLVLAFILAGFGNGIGAWVGNLANASELLGFMQCLLRHGMGERGEGGAF